MAEHQYQGRGQMGSAWQVEPGQNLTFSVLLKPQFLSVADQFLLNMAVSLAVVKALAQHLPSGLSIKWPNDIYFGNNKLGGILIENTLAGNGLKNAVVGIGINVNQQDFTGIGKSNVTSVSNILQRKADKQQILQDICTALEIEYLNLKNGLTTALKESYLNNLYRFGQLASYKSNGLLFEGTITSVQPNGALVVQVGQTTHLFNLKEIEFIIT